jgi:hypothetical protein
MVMSSGGSNNNNLKTNYNARESHISNPIYNLIAGGLIVAASIVGAKVGKGIELNNIMKIQNTKELTNPYHGYDPKADISKTNAEKYLLDMDKGEQFKYHGKKITLLQRSVDKEPTNTGYTDYFMIGNQITMLNTSNLNAKTIDDVFGK